MSKDVSFDRDFRPELVNRGHRRILSIWSAVMVELNPTSRWSLTPMVPSTESNRKLHSEVKANIPVSDKTRGTAGNRPQLRMWRCSSCVSCAICAIELSPIQILLRQIALKRQKWAQTWSNTVVNAKSTHFSMLRCRSFVKRVKSSAIHAFPIISQLEMSKSVKLVNWFKRSVVGLVNPSAAWISSRSRDVQVKYFTASSKNKQFLLRLWWENVSACRGKMFFHTGRTALRDFSNLLDRRDF